MTTESDLRGIVLSAGQPFEEIASVESFITEAKQLLDVMPEDVRVAIEKVESSPLHFNDLPYLDSGIVGEMKSVLARAVDIWGEQKILLGCYKGLKNLLPRVEEFSLPRFVQKEESHDSRNSRIVTWGLAGREACISDFEMLSFLVDVIKKLRER